MSNLSLLGEQILNVLAWKKRDSLTYSSVKFSTVRGGLGDLEVIALPSIC